MMEFVDDPEQLIEHHPDHREEIEALSDIAAADGTFASDEAVEKIGEESVEELWDAYLIRETHDDDIPAGERTSRVANTYRPEWLDDWRESRDERASGQPEDVRDYVQEHRLHDRIAAELRKLLTSERRVLSEQGQGVDVRQAIRRLVGDHSIRNIYKRWEMVRSPDRLIGVALDMSGSMDRDEEAAKAAVGAFAKGVRQLDDEICAVAFGGRRQQLITGPHERFRWTHLTAVRASGGTPTAQGVENTHDLLQEGDATEKALLVVTDGGAGDLERAQEVIAEVRADSIPVIGVGIGHVSESALRDQFGDDAYRCSSTETLPTDLFELYRDEVVDVGRAVV